jgi:hypothetical protein
MANEKQVSPKKDGADYPAVAKTCAILGALLLFIGFCSVFIFPYIIFFLWIPMELFSLLAIVLGVISLVRLKKNPLLGGRKEAIGSLVLGVMVLIIGSLLIWLISWLMSWQD